MKPKIIAKAILALLLTSALLPVGRSPFQTHDKKKEELLFLSLIPEVASLIKNNYVDAVNPEDAFKHAFSSLMESLDNFSTYLNPAQSRLYGRFEKGSLFGVGIYGSKYKNHFLVTAVDADSPASASGLQPGDLVKSVNGRNFYDLSFWEMFLSFFADSERDFEFTVLRGGKQTGETLHLHSSAVTKRVQIRKLQPEIFLLHLKTYDENSAAELENQIKEMTPSFLVLDLRRYLGGNYQGFYRIANILLDERVNIELESKYARDKIEVGGERSLFNKIVVIIDPSTIMYAELLAATFRSLSQYRRGHVVIVGMPTLGFISDLKQLFLRDGSSILISTGFYTVQGEKLENRSLEPDIRLSSLNGEDIINKAIAIIKSSDAAQKE